MLINILPHYTIYCKYIITHTCICHAMLNHNHAQLDVHTHILSQHSYRITSQSTSPSPHPHCPMLTTLHCSVMCALPPHLHCMVVVALPHIYNPHNMHPHTKPRPSHTHIITTNTTLYNCTHVHVLHVCECVSALQHMCDPTT